VCSASGYGYNGLDPVFYMESARIQWARKDTPGDVRVRRDETGRRRKMLTSTGHPGLVMDDYSAQSYDS